MHIREIGIYLTQEQFDAHEKTRGEKGLSTPEQRTLHASWWEDIDTQVHDMLRSSLLRPPTGTEIEVRIWHPSGDFDVDSGSLTLDYDQDADPAIPC